LYHGTSIAYIYCSSTGKSKTTDASAALHSIARQLSEIRGSSVLAKPVRRLYDSRERDRSSKASLSGKEMRQLLSEIFETGVDERIIIDALDECVDWRQLLRVLRDATEHHRGNLKLFCTSRFGVDLSEYFPGRMEKILTANLTKHDMESFIRQEIFSEEGHGRLLDGQYEHLEEQLALALLRRAGGMCVFPFQRSHR
jgi:hypothetical protein